MKTITQLKTAFIGINMAVFLLLAGCEEKVSLDYPTDQIYADYSVSLNNITGTDELTASAYLSAISKKSQTPGFPDTKVSIVLGNNEKLLVLSDGVTYPMANKSYADYKDQYKGINSLIVEMAGTFLDILNGNSDYQAVIENELQAGDVIELVFQRNSGEYLSSTVTKGHDPVVVSPAKGDVIGADQDDIVLQWTGLDNDELQLPATASLISNCSVDRDYIPTSPAEILQYLKQSSKHHWTKGVTKDVVAGASSATFNRAEMLDGITIPDGVDDCVVTALVKYKKPGQLAPEFAGGSIEYNQQSERLYRFRMDLAEQ